MKNRSQNEKNISVSKNLVTDNAYTQIDVIGNLTKVQKWMTECESFIIYGTGCDAEYIWNCVPSGQKKKILFCDKKAEKVTYKFKNKKVVCPDDLKTVFCDKPVLIATRMYGKEVYCELCRNGISDNRIMVII